MTTYQIMETPPIRKFHAWLCHDRGHLSLAVWATSLDRARQQIMDYEGCPESAVLLIEEVTK